MSGRLAVFIIIIIIIIIIISGGSYHLEWSSKSCDAHSKYTRVYVSVVGNHIFTYSSHFHLSEFERKRFPLISML